MGFRNIGTTNPGKRFQRHRKLLQEYFSRQKVLEYRSLQTTMARMLAIELAKNKGHESREHVLERLIPLRGVYSSITTFD
jgi:cytochrome P450